MRKISKLNQAINELSSALYAADNAFMKVRLEAYYLQNKKLAKIKKIRSNKSKKEVLK